MFRPASPDWRPAVAALACLALLLGSDPAPGGELQAFPQPIAAPALALPDLKGAAHRLQDLRGRVVVVNFWATWCPPCVEELPGMRRLAERMKDRRFELLAVNAGEGKGRIFEFFKAIGPASFPVLLDTARKAYDRWEVQVLPTSYLVDAKGDVRYRVVGALDWDGTEALDAIEGLLAEGETPQRSVSR